MSKFKVGKPYTYDWKDGGIARFIVTNVGDKYIDIQFDNGSTNFFAVNSPMYNGSQPVEKV